MENIKFNKNMRIAKVSVVDQVCATMKEAILSGEWKENERIPSETELSQTFGVNRLSVRMAIQKLNTLGFTTTKVGDGTYVKKFSMKTVFDEVAPIYASQYEDIKQLRYLLETDALYKAIHNATKEDIASLKEMLDKYHHAAHEFTKAFYEGRNEDADRLLEETVEADFNFHYCIVKMANNKLYCDIYYMVKSFIHDQIFQIVYERTERRYKAGLEPIDVNETHTLMYKCILEKDEALAKDLMNEMLGYKKVLGLDYFA